MMNKIIIFHLLLLAITLNLIILIEAVSIPSESRSKFNDISDNAVWRWECQNQQCEKKLITEDTRNDAVSLEACKILCNEFGNMWPRPNGNFVKGLNLIHFNSSNINIILQNTNGLAVDLMESAIERFHSNIKRLSLPENEINEGDRSLIITIVIKDFDYRAIALNMNESYILHLNSSSDNEITVEIKSENFFGARHGLETLYQFIIFDDLRTQFQIIDNLYIEDGPVYTYRGISLDTSRNFFNVDSIKRTLDGMAACKLNTLHWHLTDSHGFSFESKTHPNITKRGSLSPYKVYKIGDIINIVQYALERGIRVLPELDTPGHVGEGWQGTNLTMCFKTGPGQTWQGQFDVTKEELYDVLQGLYNDLFELFQPDIFHMGGDEVSFRCWNSSKDIQQWMLDQDWGIENDDFLKLWNRFQIKAKENVYKANNDKKLPIILWTSTLTEFEHVENYLSKDDYIIQVWEHSTSLEIPGLLNKGYRLIMSNYDALYFDCGFGAWVGDGNNWCSPYIGWQKVYDNSLVEIAGDNVHLILGGEAALWSEQADTSTIDSRLWPRAGALAERLWAEPSQKWDSAEKRMLNFRERLLTMGLMPDALQPDWCYQNEGYCFLSHNK